VSRADGVFIGTKALSLGKDCFLMGAIMALGYHGLGDADGDGLSFSSFSTSTWIPQLGSAGKLSVDYFASLLAISRSRWA
jgi:hypothetical protein